MDTDDIAPPPKAVAAPNLETMSIAELEARIASLTDDIAAARRMIEKKKAARGAADTMFRR